MISPVNGFHECVLTCFRVSCDKNVGVPQLRTHGSIHGLSAEPRPDIIRLELAAHPQPRDVLVVSRVIFK